MAAIRARTVYLLQTVGRKEPPFDHVARVWASFSMIDRDSRVSARLEWIGISIIFVAALFASAFKYEDAATFFNYSNNVIAPRIFYFYGGYVPVIPELTAYFA